MKSKQILKKDILRKGIVFFLLINYQTIKAQAYNDKNNWYSKVELNLEYGVVFPNINLKQSLNISSFPSFPQNENISLEEKKEEKTISNSSTFGVNILYKIKPKFSIGLAVKHINSISINSSMLFFQEKYIPSNELLVSNVGLFNMQSSINNTSVRAINSFTFIDNKKMQFYSGFGIGLSFLKLDSKIDNVLLKMEANNSITSQVNILGPGQLHTKEANFTKFSWQFHSGLKIKLYNDFNLKIGYRFSYLGSFTIFERSNNHKDLFKIQSTITGAEDQNLALNTTNAKRQLYSNTIYLIIGIN